MNKVLLVGRLTAKPELKYTSSNIAYTRFTLAINRTFTGKDGNRETDFIGILVWRKQAENVCNFLNKGSLVAVEGRIQTGSYDDKDGNKRYTTDIVADSVQFLESKNQSQGRSDNVTPYNYQETKPTNNASNKSNNANASEDPFADFGDSVSIDDNFLD